MDINIRVQVGAGVDHMQGLASSQRGLVSSLIKILDIQKLASKLFRFTL